jgi:hypothetical protein
VRFKDEDLDSQVGVEVVVAHEADHLASGQLFYLPAELDAHDALPASAQVEHRLAFAGVGEVLLAAREAVLGSTTKIPLSPSAVFAFVGPRPVVRASALTTVREIFAASSPSCLGGRGSSLPSAGARVAAERKRRCAGLCATPPPRPATAPPRTCERDHEGHLHSWSSPWPRLASLVEREAPEIAAMLRAPKRRGVRRRSRA